MQPADSPRPVEPIIVYQEDFAAALGSSFPQWSAVGYAYTGNGMQGQGIEAVTNVAAPNGERFLGEFGGPKIVSGRPFVQITDGVILTLDHLPAHTIVTVAFDLLVLKSWDGNSPQYGPDRFRLRVVDGAILLDTSFSNNHKTEKEGSFQDYPAPGSLPQTGASAINTLGYRFFGDSIYHLTFTFPHTGATLSLEFASDMYEGKGTEDESWGLDNVIISVSE